MTQEMTQEFSDMMRVVARLCRYAACPVGTSLATWMAKQNWYAMTARQLARAYDAFQFAEAKAELRAAKKVQS